MSPSPAPRIGPRKKLLFSAVAVALFLVAIESVLWLAGVQPRREVEDPFVGFAGSAPLFTPGDGGDFVTASNKRGYFNLQRFPAMKAENTFRVFCLGGSTTYGRPYADATSFAGWLRELLPEADRDRRFEVINAGGISYASYRVARLVGEIVQYDPDLLVIYTGHNEFLEERTYAQVRDRVPALRVAMEAARSTRIGSVLAAAIAGDRDEPVDGRTILPTEVQARLDHSAGLDLYRRDDALTRNVERHFEESLRGAVARCREAEVKVLLVTPASNVSGFSPFKAESSLTDGGDRVRFDAALEASQQALQAGDADAAVEAAREAVILDARHAGAHWQLGRSLLAHGDAEAAGEPLRRARDEDVCTLRATTRLQQIVREVAREEEVPLLDYVEDLREESQRRGDHGLVGENFFLDHVHPTIEGHRLLAVALIERLAEEGWIDLDPAFGDETVARIASRVEDSVTAEEHARALANLALTLSWAGKAEDSERLTQRALESGVEDPTILLMAARHASVKGRNAEALAYYRRAIAAEPNNAVTRSQMGFFLSGIGQREAAVVQFYLASLMWKDNETYHQQLGFALERIGRADLALAAFQRALELAPQDESLRAKVERLESRVPVEARMSDLQPRFTRHASGYPATLHTAHPDASGKSVPHGFRATWYESGELESFVHLRDGRESDSLVRWDRSGSEIERRNLNAPH